MDCKWELQLIFLYQQLQSESNFVLFYKQKIKDYQSRYEETGEESQLQWISRMQKLMEAREQEVARLQKEIEKVEAYIILA